MQDFDDLKVRREYNIPPIVVNIINDKELIKKISITLAIVVFYRLISFITIPGINGDLLRQFFENIARSQGDTLFGITHMFTGGAMSRLTIMALGIMPFISACLIVQLLCFVVPYFKRSFMQGGQGGREKIVRNTYYVTALLSVVQAFFISLWLENPARFQGLKLVLTPGWAFRITTVVSLTAGVFLLLWLAKIINKYGFGNGIAIFVLSGILSRIPSAVRHLVFLYKNNRLSKGQILFMVIALVVSTAVIWLVTRSATKIPIGYVNSDIKSSITLRFSWPSDAPIMYAQTVVLFPATLV